MPRKGFYSPQDGYNQWRKSDILSAIEDLSPMTYQRLMDAAVRIQLHTPGVSIEDAVVAIVTYYATDDLMPVHDLPK
jgi:hypothetical protein